MIMKKKLLLTLLMVAVLTVVFALAISARTNYRENRTYEYYDQNGKLLYSATAIYAIDSSNKGKYRYEVIISESEMNFAKTDANGNALTWYAVSDDKDSDGDNIQKIVVASALTSTLGTIDSNGQFTYSGVEIDGITVSVKNVVSANFFDMDIAKFPNAFFMTTADTVPNGNASEYCQMTNGSYLLALYLPDTLTAIPDQFCQRSTVRIVEFENGRIAGSQTLECKKINNLEGGPFSYCANLKAISIPEGITDIATKSFRECLGIQYVKFPSTMKSLSNINTFWRGALFLETVVLGENMTKAVSLNNVCNRFYVGESYKENATVKYIYVPNGINVAGSTFDSYKGKENEGYLGDDVNISVVFLFSGTLEQAKEVAKNTDRHFNAAVNGWKSYPRNTTDPGQEPITWEEYCSNKKYYDNLPYDCHVLVYNVPKCDAFYDGAHIEGTDVTVAYANGFTMSGVCTTACTRKGCIGIKSECAPIVTPKGYAVTEATSGLKASITSGFAINGEALALYESINGVSLEIGLAMTGVGEDSALREADTMTLGDFRATKALKTEAGFAYASVDYRVNLSKEEQKDLQIIVCLYLSVGDNIELIQSKDTGVDMAGGLQLVSYNHIYKMYA